MAGPRVICCYSPIRSCKQIASGGPPRNACYLSHRALLLTASNVFMTFAWYAHLKNLNDHKWYIAVIASWSIALFEYLLQVPANRIGYTQLSLAQTESYPGSDHLVGVCAVCGALYAPAAKTRLPVGRVVSARSRLFYV
jgi:uncharacterized protein (DUF486 family)